MYTIANITNVNNRFVYNEIIKFVKTCGFSSVATTSEGTVFKIADFYIYIFATNDKHVLFSFSRGWDSSKGWWQQTDSIIADKVAGKPNIFYVLPCRVGSLYLNFAKDSSFMFSVVGTAPIRETDFVFFGRLNNVFSEFNTHLLVGGTRVDYSPKGAGTQYEAVETAVSEDKSMYLCMYVEVDYSPSAARGRVVWATDFKKTSLTLATSYANEYNRNSLPMYADMMSKSPQTPGYNYAQLNGISLCLPIICYIIRDPHLLDCYSVVGSTSIFTYVDMYNISSGRWMDSDYPIEKQRYHCFIIHKRRNGLLINGAVANGGDTGIYMGYAGVAFRWEGNG